MPALGGTISANDVSGTLFGIALAGVGGGRPTNNTIKDNVVTGSLASGIQVQDADYNTVKANAANGNALINNGGIVLSDAHYNTVADSEANSNLAGAGVLVSGASEGSHDNTVRDNRRDQN